MYLGKVKKSEAESSKIWEWWAKYKRGHQPPGANRVNICVMNICMFFNQLLIDKRKSRYIFVTMINIKQIFINTNPYYTYFQFIFPMIWKYEHNPIRHCCVEWFHHTNWQRVKKITLWILNYWYLGIRIYLSFVGWNLQVLYMCP